jgi:hypothetical protein
VRELGVYCELLLGHHGRRVRASKPRRIILPAARSP